MTSDTTVNRLNIYSGQVISAAMTVHSKLGPGLLESTYQACLLQELRNRMVKVQSQVELPVEYEGTRLEVGYRIDLLVEDSIVVELKAVEKIRPIHRAQMMSYLKLTGLRIGLLINFNTVSLRNGINRIINGY